MWMVDTPVSVIAALSAHLDDYAFGPSLSLRLSNEGRRGQHNTVACSTTSIRPPMCSSLHDRLAKARGGSIEHSQSTHSWVVDKDMIGHGNRTRRGTESFGVRMAQWDEAPSALGHFIGA